MYAIKALLSSINLCFVVRCSIDLPLAYGAILGGGGEINVCMRMNQLYSFVANHHQLTLLKGQTYKAEQL